MSQPHARGDGRGEYGEELAVRHLRRVGLRILDRNWRAGHREIDIVAQEGDVVAFVEVKTRSAEGPQHPLDALGRAQRRALLRVAGAWIHTHPGAGREFRFDLIGIEIPAYGPPRIHHLRDAFRGEDC